MRISDWSSDVCSSDLIKHMGDGIMAVFPVVHAAVQGAVMIQQRIARHNGDTTAAKFHVRIGINAGEPIREGGDFFGTPVQLAARVMSVAGADEIAVRSEEHTSELQSLMRISYAVFCLKKKKETTRCHNETKKTNDTTTKRCP